MFTLVKLLALVIIGGFLDWFGCSLLFYFLILFNFNNFLIFLYYLFYFLNFILLLLLKKFFFLSFFLPFLLSHVADRVLVLQPGVRPEPLRWESRVQDTGPRETSQPHIISISESSPRDLHLNSKTQLHPTASKLQCWTPHAKKRARQEHNPTH